MGCGFGGGFPGGVGSGILRGSAGGMVTLPCCGRGSGVQSQPLALQNFAGGVGGVAQLGGSGVLSFRACGVKVFLVVVQRILALLLGQRGEQLRQLG